MYESVNVVAVMDQAIRFAVLDELPKARAVVADIIEDRKALNEALALAYTWIVEARSRGTDLPADNTLAACRAALGRYEVTP